MLDPQNSVGLSGLPRSGGRCSDEQAQGGSFESQWQAGREAPKAKSYEGRKLKVDFQTRENLLVQI